MTHAKGYLLDSYDPRDRDELTEADKLPAMKDVAELPRRVDLRESGYMPEIWDQGQLGSCTAHGTLGNYQYHVAKQGLDVAMRSRLALYYAARALEHDVATDAGAQVRDAVKAIAHGGIDPESEWPYDIKKFAERPPRDTDTAQHAAISYFRVLPSRTHLLNRLAQGFPITDGMPVYASMETEKVAETGNVPMPKKGEKYEGGHCTLTIGYDLDATDADGNKGILLKRNSWGTGWGKDGYFTLPLAYANFLSDRWALRTVD
jgi:C1A family cysteine protease